MGKALLQITLKILPENRPKAADVYTAYRQRFLSEIPGACQKDLLIRAEDVQVLHGFASTAAAEAYLGSELFRKDVCSGLAPLLTAEPEVRIYERA
ncbi:MAG TPA: hypothetical protein VN436_07675 [Holophaga sp.]|nr:hypothetical protein [Holophaga sp.]